MYRYFVALVVGLLLPAAFADSLDPSRDANLALFGTTCVLVSVQSQDSSITATEHDIVTAVMNKALLYSVPVKDACTSDDFANMPSLFVTFTALPSAFDYAIQVVLPFAGWGPTGGGGPRRYSDVTVWEESGITTHLSGTTPQDIKDRAGKLFDDFALAWKKQHQP